MISPRNLLAALLLGGLLITSAPAQIARSRIYSRPEVPGDDVLRRLNLVVVWKAAVPVGGQKDGILRTDLDGNDLFVLTRSGLVVRLDAETGRTRWRVRVATRPYTLAPFLAANSRSVYVVANVEAFAYDRATGSRKWEHRIQNAVSAAPVVDEQQVYIPTASGRLNAYYLPFVGAGESKGSEGDVGSSPVYGPRRELVDIRPMPVWSEQTSLTLSFRPLQTSDTLFVVTPEGQAMGFSKSLAEGATSTEIFTFSTEGKVRVPPGQFGNVGYVGSDDAAVYAINLTNGKLRWRHTAGTAITRRPIALENDLFITSQREGMARLDRDSGDTLWRVPRGRAVVESNYDADEFLAANDRYVYATDDSGRLLILDRRRGTRLSMLDTTAFRVRVVNEVTDRLYLAAHNGLIVCLRDRDQVKPIRHRRVLEETSSSILKLLAQPVTAPEGKPRALRDVLGELRTKYKLKFVVAERAFKEAGSENVQDRNVSTPRSDNRPLKDYLQRTLSQVNATYQVVEDTILITPAAKK